MRSYYQKNNAYGITKRELKEIGKEKFGYISVETLEQLGGKCSMDAQPIVCVGGMHFFCAKIDMENYIFGGIIRKDKSGRQIVTQIFAPDVYQSKDRNRYADGFVKLCADRLVMKGVFGRACLYCIYGVGARVLEFLVKSMLFLVVISFPRIGAGRCMIASLMLCIAIFMCRVISREMDTMLM